MTQFRPYRNSDSPILARLWNQGAPGLAVARPLSAHEFDARVIGTPLFERAGLIVAEQAGQAVGFVHAGFGAEHPEGPPWRLSHELGCIAMLVVDRLAAVSDPGLATALLAQGETYLRDRGASVFYAGGAFPVNPFYWSVYGGSEYAGILGSNSPFAAAALASGYERVGTTVLLELDLTQPEVRDPRVVLIRRQARLELTDDAMLPDWWSGLALGEFRPMIGRVFARTGDSDEFAQATLWDMDWFGRVDGHARIGLCRMEVAPEFRRKGYGRFLLLELARVARDQGASILALQTASTNTAALALYQSVGFEQVETATLYRRPGPG